MINRFHQLSIGKKLQAINLLIVGLITVVTIISMCIYMYGTLRDDYQNDSKILSRLLAENVNSALLFGDKKSARDALAGLQTVDDVTHAELYDKDGNLFAGYTKAAGSFNVPPHFDPQGFRQDIHFGSLTYDSTFPVLSVTPEREQVGTITMQMNLSTAYMHLGYQIAALLLIGLIGAALISTVLAKLQSRITQPLLTLIETMRNVSKSGDLSARAIPYSKDEIGELANVFNQMLDQISQRDISLNQELIERRRIEGKLSEIAHFDPVTKLPNRHSFNNQIDKLLLDFKYDQENFALMFVDLDNFKYVNDTYGHHAGDILLFKAAERLRKSLRQEDFIARLGGDEFVILMKHFNSVDQVSAVAAKLLKALSQPFTVAEHEAFIGASIGITLCPEHGDTHETLQRQADSAMYQAKRNGKNNYQYYQAHLSLIHENRVSLEAQLRRSLERNEIVVYYQPILEIASDKIVGFEALVRWIKQDGVIISPDAFIPLAEEIGFIRELGHYVMQTAIAQIAAWIEQFGPVFIAVNFSSKQFKYDHLADDVLQALAKSDLKAWNFEVEITESVLMDNASDSMDVLSEFSKLGISISIDDFGTGYSSLSYLTHFPVNKLKIDRSFVNKLPHDRNAFAVINAIISLANSLNLKVVAEGIETVEQQTCLIEMGCQYGQGYLFSKPVPAAQAANLLALQNKQTTH